MSMKSTENSAVSAGQSDAGFVLNRSQEVTALSLTVEEYTHVPTGAKHFHLANNYAENVFMLAFRTVPDDSTGVAHMLEHTVLCGSEKYPVRDPFFLMIRRSLNTFMNAFTTSDYTAYPFASQNRKDYQNLLEVYLDAAFFSRLHPLDFAQEGHRLEFEQADDPSTPLCYQGVVFNEMKGDTSSPMSMLYHAIQKELYPTSTYHFNSGGDPKDIPNLTYEGLRDFYQTHYHPTNAVFMTCGDMPAAQQQQLFHEFALNKFTEPSCVHISVQPENRFDTPVTSVGHYPVDVDDLSGKTHIVIAWLLGENTDLPMLLRCHLLSDVLLDTSASPLRQALEQCPLATAASPMCGFEEDHREMNFMCGVEGSEPEHADVIEALIFEVLEKVAREGVETTRLEAVLHQLELSQREVGGDGSPYGLQLIFSCMSAAIHRGDPIGLLDLEPAVEQLRRDIQDPEFIKGLVKELLLDNKHRVRVVMVPDRQLGATLIAEEKNTLEAIKQSLSAQAVKDLLTDAAALRSRQSEEEDLAVLPSVGINDIPAVKRFPTSVPKVVAGLTLTACDAGTNGITYHQVVSDLPALTSDLLALMPVYSALVTELGSAERNYLDTQHLQHAVSGGISAFASIRTDLDNCDEGRGYLTVSSRTLNSKAGQMLNLVKDTALAPRFDEIERIRELVSQMAMRRINGIASNGHQFAMSAASARIRPASAISDFQSGIPGVLRLKQLSDSLADPETCLQLSDKLVDLHERLRGSANQFLLIADKVFLDNVVSELEGLWQSVPSNKQSDSVAFDFTLPADCQATGSPAFVVTTQVNYCASAYATIPENHEDSAALSVLAGVLRNNYLHAAIRERGGAYGGGAGHDAINGVFRFYSYRDPKIVETFAAFEQAIDWALKTPITDAMIEESVLGIMASIDSPGSPSGELKQAFHHQLFGRDATHRMRHRQRFLQVRQLDLKRVTDRYLLRTPYRALVTSENRLKEIDNKFDIVQVANASLKR